MSTDRPEIKAEILECKVEGCNRKVVGDSAAMANHVLNSEDDLHENMILDKDGELMNVWGW